jgi:putative Ca2+/H+ antiporter (TMEM165/GDT1 family)
MNPDVAAAVERLRGDGVLEDRAAKLFGRVARRELVSVRVEIRAALYVGVLLLTAGVGLFVKENHERIGPAAIGLAIGVGAAACLVWAARHSAPFAWGEATSAHAGFDYVLLLGALLVATDLAYLETQFALLGPGWPWHLLVVAVLYGFLAYRFDSRMVLSLALASFAAWRGIAVSVGRTSLGSGDPARLRVEALACGALFVALGVAAVRRQKKTHFEDVYVNAGLLLVFGGLLSGVFGDRADRWGAWLLALLLVAAAVAVLGFRAKRTLPFALAVVAAYVAVLRPVFEIRGAKALPPLLAAVLAALALLFIVFARRRMKVP